MTFTISAEVVAFKDSENYMGRKYSEFSKRVTITSALPYVNGVKHIGNIVGSLLPADIFHRFLDLLGVDNIYICGTDDHGTAIEIAAADAGIAPDGYVERYHKVQKDIYKLWNFDFSFFGQTSSKTNHEITRAIFLAAHKNGYTLHKEIIIPYCSSCKRFLPDRYIVGTCPKCGYDTARGDQCEKCSTVLDPADLKDARCNVCNKSDITFRKENHIFLNYTLLSDKLKSWIEKTDWHANTKAAALGWIDEGLEPRCITRNINWGINVPLEGYENLVFYVWFDAPIGYISITKDWDRKNWKEYWTDSKIYHFLGKDNIPFHTIFWPGTLIASKNTVLENDRINFVLPHKVVGYEYLNWEGQKFSTSKGIGLFSDEAADLFPIDYWRFYLASVLPENKDSNFDWDDFQRRINNELIANYGNLFYRVTHFIKENFEGKVPKGQLDDDGRVLYKKLGETMEKIERNVSEVRLKSALSEILSFASDVNKYFQDKKPWEKEDIYHVGNTIYTAVNLLRSITTMLYPYVPAASLEGLKALGLGEAHLKWDNLLDEKIKVGQRVEAKLLFRKIDDPEISRAKSYVSRYSKNREITEKGIKTAGKIDMRKDNIKAVDGMIPFDEFQKVELVVGTIVDVKDHPDATKLYVLEVDIGSETRQLVAGLREKYKKDALKGKQVIMVANLEPKELRGVKSHGMILAAGDSTILSPAEPVANGSKVR